MAKKNQGTVRWDPAFLAGAAGRIAAPPPPAKGVPRPTTPPPPGTFGTPGNAPGQSNGGVTPQPYDPNVDQAAITGGRNVALTNADSAYQIGNLSFDYGYNPDGSVNTANPYSRATLYMLAHDNARRDNTNGYAAQGQLYSGALGSAQNLADSNYAKNDAANRLAFARAVHGVQTGQLNAYANAGTGTSGADFQALLKSVYPSSGG